MRTRLLVAAVSAGFATACSWTTVEAAGSGTVYVSRDSAFVGSLVGIDIAIDGKVLGSVSNGGCTRLQIPAGRHSIGSPNFWGTVRDGATINVPSGGHVYVTAIVKVEFPGPVSWAAMVVTAKGRRC
jgi:hypothetical protein